MDKETVKRQEVRAPLDGWSKTFQILLEYSRCVLRQLLSDVSIALDKGFHWCSTARFRFVTGNIEPRTTIFSFSFKSDITETGSDVTRHRSALHILAACFYSKEAHDRFSE